MSAKRFQIVKSNLAHYMYNLLLPVYIVLFVSIFF